MVAVFHAPKTFTTENSVEISFHGSPHIAKKRILEVLIKNGARMAKSRGIYTSCFYEWQNRPFAGGIYCRSYRF